MKLKKQCKFSMKNPADVIRLHSDMEDIRKDIMGTKTKEGKDSKVFISRLFTYFEERPSIRKAFEISENKDGEEDPMDFTLFMARSHLRSVTLHRIMEGKEKDPNVIKEFQEDIDQLKKFALSVDKNLDREKEVNIPVKTTGVKIFDTIEKQIKFFDSGSSPDMMNNSTNKNALA